MTASGEPRQHGRRPTREAIGAALDETKGDVTAAAAKLGVHRATVYRVLKNAETKGKPMATASAISTLPDGAVVDALAFIDALAELAPGPALERVNAAIAATRARQVEVTRERTLPSTNYTRLAALREEFIKLDEALVELEHEQGALRLAVDRERVQAQQRQNDIASARALFEGLLAGLSEPELAEIPVWCYQMLDRERLRVFMLALRKRLATDRERLRSLDAEPFDHIDFKL